MGVSALVSDQFAQHFPKSEFEDVNDEELSDEQKKQKAIDAVIKEVMERFAIILVTQPLHVVTVRSIASYVGQETDYQNILTGLLSIYKDNGILGTPLISIPSSRIGPPFLCKNAASLNPLD